MKYTNRFYELRKEELSQMFKSIDFKFTDYELNERDNIEYLTIFCNNNHKTETTVLKFLHHIITAGVCCEQCDLENKNQNVNFFAESYKLSKFIEKFKKVENYDKLSLSEKQQKEVYINKINEDVFEALVKRWNGKVVKYDKKNSVVECEKKHIFSTKLSELLKGNYCSECEKEKHFFFKK